MIHQNNDELSEDFEIKEYSNKTYYLDIEKNRINGMCDGITAIKQAIYKILNTERYEHLIYSWNYGVELKELIGENEMYVIPELERVIKEALLQDDRITAVYNFEFTRNKGTILVTFNVVTNIGEFSMDKVVNI